MITTRLGENCKLVINGDPSQCDLKRSGLPVLEQILKGIDGISIVRFEQVDIVRHKVVNDVVLSFERYENNES